MPYDVRRVTVLEASSPMSAAGIAENRYAGSSAPHRTEPCMKDVTPSFSCLPSLSEGASWQRIVPARKGKPTNLHNSENARIKEEDDEYVGHSSLQYDNFHDGGRGD